MLTENLIKHEAMSYLKGYYKFKPRGEGGTIVKFDMRTAEGYIADGHLQFNDPDGKPFIVTLEATSAAKRKEVVYETQHKLLNWDSASLSILVTVIVLLAFTRLNFMDYNSYGLSLGLLSIWVIGLLFFICFKLSLRYLDRYKYIYAIEQFLKYKVDEQWICIGFDVFPNGSDRKFRQLRKRCVANGVGLLVLEESGQIRPVVMAERRGEEEQIPKTIFTDLDHWVGNLRNKMSKRVKADLSMLRFQPKFYHQQLVLACCICFLSFMMYRKYEQFKLDHQEADEIVQEVYELNANQIPEPDAYQVNESALNQYSKQIDFQETPDDSLSKVYKAWLSSEQKSKAEAKKVDKEFTLSKSKGIDNCQKWKNIGNGYHLLIKGKYKSEREALDQQLFVSRHYESVGILPSSCIGHTTANYYVYIGKPTKDARAIEQMLNKMNHDENYVLKPKEKRFSIISLFILGFKS